MRLLISSFWRAWGYCLHPKVIALSLLPLLLLVSGTFALAYVYWDAAVQGLMAWLEQWQLYTAASAWLQSVGLEQLRSVVVPMILLALVIPLVVVLSLLLVAWLMTPAMVELVARRRFPALEKCHGGNFWRSVAWSAWYTLLAGLMALATLPLWLLPPLALVLPPLIWGWLSYRVFAFDALAEHASVDERDTLLQRHRWSLLLMGVSTGYLGAAPALLWASGALFIALAPLLVPLAIWIYALVFAFSSLWFAHFLLEALQDLRSECVVVAAPSFTTPRPMPDQVAVGEVLDVQARELP